MSWIKVGILSPIILLAGWEEGKGKEVVWISVRGIFFSTYCYNHINNARNHDLWDLYARLTCFRTIAKLPSDQIERDLPGHNARLLRVLIRHQRALREVGAMRDRIEGQSDPLGQQEERFRGRVCCQGKLSLHLLLLA